MRARRTAQPARHAATGAAANRPAREAVPELQRAAGPRTDEPQPGTAEPARVQVARHEHDRRLPHGRVEQRRGRDVGPQPVPKPVPHERQTVGRWLLGFPAFTSTDAYRRVHMAHHREEFFWSFLA